VSAADLSIIGFQLVLPAALLIWYARWPAPNMLAYLIQTGTVVLSLLALCLIPIWLVPPWWMAWMYVAIAIALGVHQIVRKGVSTQYRVPRSVSAWAGTVVLALCAFAVATLNYRALAGRVVPDEVLDLDFPMGPGTYLVANGGSTDVVNGHFLTLDPQTDRQRNYRGQSYAVDLIKLGDFGLRATGWRPRDPAVYAIYGEPVLAPCAGRVVAAQDGKADMPVPEMDTSLLEGNHVFMDCSGFGVLLAHLRQGSLEVAIGDFVGTGDKLGEAGNSGQSAEPHLHIHAQQIPTEGSLLSGDPVFVTFDGRFLVRNDRVSIGPRD
jgi:murein DD-endopeptidase MepM/ murein hydrolase activator NlpD